MQTVASSRTEHQQLMDALLTELDLRRRQLYRLQAAGVQRAGMRQLKGELQAVRERLGEITAAV
jgi:hypothetical protein